MNKILIGADPEVFLTMGGKVVSAAQVIPGTKSFPYAMGCGSIHPDNILAEINIPPAASEADFYSSISSMLKALRVFGCELDFSPSYKFTPDQLDEFGKAALEFGCTPDKYIAGSTANSNKLTNVRSAGGHIHISNGTRFSNDPDYLYRLVICLDFMMGIPSIVYEGKAGLLRRSVYGALGCYRDKPYGVEYRAISGMWLKNEQSIRWAYKAAHLCAEYTDEIFDIIKGHYAIEQVYGCFAVLDSHDAIGYARSIADYMHREVLRVV